MLYIADFTPRSAVFGQIAVRRSAKLPNGENCSRKRIHVPLVGNVCDLGGNKRISAGYEAAYGATTLEPRAVSTKAAPQLRNPANKKGRAHKHPPPAVYLTLGPAARTASSASLNRWKFLSNNAASS